MSRVRRVLTVVVAGLCVLAVGTACDSPAFTYVTNADDGLYFKVPSSWQRVDQGRLDTAASSGLSASDAAALKAASWTVAYDADHAPSVEHLFATRVTRPVAFSRVLRVSEDNRGGVTMDFLRNLFLPITASARAQAAARGNVLPKPDIRSDHVVTRNGLRGVHTIFRYALAGAVETFDQTAYKARDGSRAYLLLVRCTQTCYSDRYDTELGPVIRSFTVGSAS